MSLRRLLLAVGLATLVPCLLLWDERGAPAQAAPPAPNFAGTWYVRGWELGKGAKGEPSYECTVKVARGKKDRYDLAWHIGERVNPGVGLYDARTGVFATGYTIGEDRPGVAVYQLSEDARTMTCVGTFRGARGVAHEEWRRDE